MSCIICNENPEKLWPKRWQCWNDNGKFAESLCKLLGLPTFPYKTDFQNSVYCGSCQKRVYNAYLMMRKWDKLQDEISKLKTRLKKDFRQSLRKVDLNSSGGEDTDKSAEKWVTCGTNEQNSGNSGNSGSCSSEENLNTIVRLRILKRLDKRNWDCDCDCCDTANDTPATNVKCGVINKKLPPCGYPDCQDKDCLSKWKEDKKKEGKPVKREDAEGDDDGSDSDWSSHPENDCDDDQCNLCYSAKDRDKKIEEEEKPENAHNNGPCFSADAEFCADCSLCKADEEKARSNRNQDTAAVMVTKIKRERVSDQEEGDRSSAEEMGGSDFKCVRETASDSFSAMTRYRDKENPVKVETITSFKRENDPYAMDEEDTMEQAKEDETDADATIADSMKESRRFRCDRPNCTRTFLSQDDMDIHIKRHHEGIKCPFICDQCGKAFQWRRELTAHVFKHSGEFAVCCHLCGRGFRTKQLFKVHLKTKHGGERKYKCEVCDKAFISESKLNTHLTIHTKVYPFSCVICGKGFSAKTFLNFHMSKHMEANPYQCATCGKIFSSPRNLRIHQYIHTNSHPYKCSICQAGVTSEVLLQKHMLKHNKDKSSICYICNKKFRFPSSLKKHQKIHNGERKKFSCQLCNKAFIDKYKLTRHLRVHRREEPFLCTDCKQSFTSKEELDDHINLSHQTIKIESPISSSLDPVATTPQPTTNQPILMEDEAISDNDEDLQLPEIDEPLSAYLPDGFPTDASFLDTLNPEDEDLVVTTLDLESFSKEELRLTDRQPVVHQQPENEDSENSVPNSDPTLLPDFQTLLRNSNRYNYHDFSSFSLQSP